jgi:hypothetical protein
MRRERRFAIDGNRGAEPVQGFLARVSGIGRASVYRLLEAGGV